MSTILPSTATAPPCAASAARARAPPSPFVGAPRKGAMHRSELLRMNAQLAAEAERAGAPRVGFTRRDRRSWWTRRPPAPRCPPHATPARAASGHAAASRSLPRCPDRAEVERAEQQTLHARRAPARARSKAERRLSISGRMRLRRRASSLAAMASVSALGSTMPATPGMARAQRVVGEPGVSTPLMRTSTGCARRSARPPAHRAPPRLSAGCTASSRSRITASAPAAQRLVEAFGPVARHEQIRARHACCSPGRPST